MSCCLLLLYCASATGSLFRSERGRARSSRGEWKTKKSRKEKKKYLFHSIFNMKRKRFISIEFSHTTERAMSKAEWKRMNGMREEIVSFPDIFILGQRQLKQKRVIKRPIVCSSQLWASATSLRQTWRELNAGRKKLKNYQKNIVNQTTERS